MLLQMGMVHPSHEAMRDAVDVQQEVVEGAASGVEDAP